MVQKLKRSQSPKSLLKQPLQSSQSSLLAKWFRNSETILVARLTAVSGFVIAVLNGLDWSSFINLDITDHKQFTFAGLGLLAHGFVTELARRRPGSSDPV